MTKQQKNRAFAKMLKEFPKAFGRVSFREYLMLRIAFDYVVEEVIADIKANCDLAIKGRDVKIMELEQQIEKMKCCSNCKHFNKEDDLECCQNCERQLVNSLDNLSREEIIKDEWEIKK